MTCSASLCGVGAATCTGHTSAGARYTWDEWSPLHSGPGLLAGPQSLASCLPAPSPSTKLYFKDLEVHLLNDD